MLPRSTQRSTDLTFGVLLKQLRKRAGMTQGDLAAALGYSIALISSLEKAQRRPDLQAVTERFIPALGLQDDPHLAASLIEQAALARGERPPTSITLQRTTQFIVHEEQRVSRGQLPVPPTQLIGRTAEVNQLCNRLLGHSGRLLTLVGPPGVGKTTLALAVARQLQQHYRDGAHFVPLAAASDPLVMATTIIGSVAPGDTSAKSPESRLIELLRHRALLLVLDNLEQIGGAAPLIATILAECPAVTILATSRERLHLRAEQRFKVPPLELPAAVELFVQRAQAVDSAFEPVPEQEAVVAAICQRLDCLPLALELCAAQIDLLSLNQLLTQLQDSRLDLLVAGSHDLPLRQHKLRTAIEHSYRLLSEDERILFRRLGVFIGGFDLTAVAAIGGQDQETGTQTVLATLHALMGKSLVYTTTLVNSEQRFFLLETIREFALEQLWAHEEEALARQHHFVVYLELFRTVDPHLRGPEVDLWFARVQPDYDNLRAAVQWTLAQARYADTAWLLVATNWYCRLRGQWYEELGWFQAVLPHRHQLDSTLQLTFLLCFCSLARSPAAFATVNGYAGELTVLIQMCANKVLQAGVWHFLAKAAPDFSQAARAWERALVLARAAGNLPGLGRAFGVAADHLFVLGGILDYYASRLIEHGDFAQAALLIEEELTVSKTRGFYSGIGAALSNLALLALLQGDLAQAHRQLTEAVALTTVNLFPAIHAKAQTLLGLVTLYHDDPIAARQLLLESLALWANIGDKPYLLIVQIYLAETALWEGKPAEAEEWFGQGLPQQVDPRWIGSAAVNCLYVAARLAVARQQHQCAATLFGLAEETQRHLHYQLVALVRTQIEAALATVQAVLEPTVFAEAFTAGQQMPLADAFATILMPSSIR